MMRKYNSDDICMNIDMLRRELELVNPHFSTFIV